MKSVDKKILEEENIVCHDYQNEKFNNSWLEWQVVLDDNKKDLISFDFSIVEKTEADLSNHKVSVPINAIYHLVEKLNWLQVLRSPQHRPMDPYELVQFIRGLEER